MGKRIVIKVGTSTLTYENGKINLRRVEKLCKVISDLNNRGEEVIFVTSGAIGVGVGKLSLKERPSSTMEKQAVAAVGQCELMFMYDKLFSEYYSTVAQVLLTKYSVDSEHKRLNVLNTLNTLLSMDIIPIVNENDTVAIDELSGENIGDNDMLSAIVAELVGADLLIILTDRDGLYTASPSRNPDAKKIDVVEEINEEIFNMASGSTSNRGTGGMITKLHAASLVTNAEIDCRVMSGKDPEKLYDVIDKDTNIGTLFKGKVTK
ncbi:MAG: glutamate 5-kinase [Oscillospiraceae bacterium]|nr:glutamate 5-kinase [Candidatus Ruminococcus equi]